MPEVAILPATSIAAVLTAITTLTLQNSPPLPPSSAFQRQHSSGNIHLALPFAPRLSPPTNLAMPSVKNCNVPNKARRVAARHKAQRDRSRAGLHRNPRGTLLSSVLLPTSGPAAPLSGKKARKLARAQGHARRRAAAAAPHEQDVPEVVMRDA
jgi:hypothetical protein